MQALPSLDQFTVVQNVLQMGFDPMCVANLVENKYMLTGTFYLSESELVSHLLQPDWEESSSAEERRGMPDSHTHVLGAGLTSYSLHLEHCCECLAGLPSLFLGWN